jgi:DNA-binding MarR family transcriptional regulator
MRFAMRLTPQEASNNTKIGLLSNQYSTLLNFQMSTRKRPHAQISTDPRLQVRGLSAWLALVRTYQKCSEVMSASIKPLGLKLAQHDVLMSLLLEPQQSQQQLAQRSFVTKSHMSGVIVQMVEHGWLKRADSAIDKRSHVVTLTTSGKALARRAFAVQTQVVQLMMQALSDKQMADLESMSRDAEVALSAHESGLRA